MIVLLTSFHLLLVAYVYQKSFLLILIAGLIALSFLKREMSATIKTVLLFSCILCLSAAINLASTFSKTILLAMLFDVIVIWTLLYQIYYPPRSKDLFLRIIKTVLKTGGIIAFIFYSINLFFPKININLFALPIQGNKIGYGGDSEMNPGEIAELEQSDEVAFRVRMNFNDNPLVSRLFWRGRTLSRTRDGLIWHAGKEINRPADYVPETEKVHQWVLLEPRLRQTFFSLDTPIRPLTENQSDYYEADAALNSFRSRLSQDEMKELIALPKSIDPRFRSLVNSFSTDHPNLTTFSNRLGSYYQKNFKLRLDPGKYSGNRGLTDFFFERREGFCEHFAGSFAFLLRMAGFPARVVTGFYGADYNPWSNTYVIRDHHAHAWVEGWDASRKQWLRIDPTSIIPISGKIEAHEKPSSFSMLIDTIYTRVSFYYLAHVTDEETQIASIILIALIALAWLFRRYQKRFRPDPLFAVYENYCRFVSRFGIERAPREGPTDFLNRCLGILPEEHTTLRNGLTHCTRSYILLRYRSPASPSEVLILKQDLKRLKRIKANA